MTECLPWWGARNSSGYGVTRRPGNRRLLYAHRLIWEECFGPVPDGRHLHHRCGRKECVNPEHLQIVTPSEHGVIHFRKSHCKHGHEYTPKNSYFHKGKRHCRTCIRAAVRRYQAKKKAAA